MWEPQHFTGALLWYLWVSEMTCYFRLYWRMALFFQHHNVQLALSYSCHPSVSHGEWWRVFNFNPRFVYFLLPAVGEWRSWRTSRMTVPSPICQYWRWSDEIYTRYLKKKNYLPIVQKIIRLKEDVTRLKMVAYKFFQGASFLSRYTRRCNFIYIRKVQAS